MRTRHLAWGLGLASLLLAGCSETVAPADDYELPEADPSLDPDRLTVGDYLATPCAFGLRGDGLEHLLRRPEWALVDVFFGRASADEPADGPVQGDVQLVEAHGGRVLYAFNVPAVRARIVLFRVPALVQEGHWITVRDVPDATRFDLDVIVGFTRPVDAADLETVASLGGRVLRVFGSLEALHVLLPDRMAPALRGRAGVRTVEPNGIACLA